MANLLSFLVLCVTVSLVISAPQGGKLYKAPAVAKAPVAKAPVAKASVDKAPVEKAPVDKSVAVDTAATRCVSDCTGVPNGDYQSCNGCNVYVTCSNYLTYDNRPCPANLVWDDNIKRCEWESSTCGGNASPCISDCHGVENGDYQSCNGCNVYVTCSNYLTYDNRPCPANLVWDDIIKRCEWTSRTCT